MHDNHTFTKIEEASVEAIVDKARALAREKSGHYGMLCPAILLYGDKEIRRVGPCVHAKHYLEDTIGWEEAIRADPDAIRLIEAGSGLSSR